MPKKLIVFLYLAAVLLIIAGCSPEKTQPTAITDSEPIEEHDVNEDTNEELDDTIAVGQQNDSLSKMIVHYIDVGQGDATLLEFNDEDGPYTMLIDTGDWNSTDVVSYLKAENIATIDIIAITHPHADHIGQLDKIINTFDVTEVWMNGETASSEVFAKSLAAIEDKGVDYYEPEIGEVFDIGPLAVTVFHPSSLAGGTNDNSLGLHLQYGDISFLFTGDGETKAEREMLAQGGNLHATILHAGHHGSKTSTTEDFFRAVDPEVVVYSAGLDNQYGHPDQEVIDRVNSNGKLLYGTDVHGTIRLETDGVTYTIETNKQGKVTGTSVASPEKKEPEEAKSPAVSTVNCIDINKAPTAETQHIIHIGPERSQMLIEQRPYDSIDDLTKIKGIGPARIKDIIEQGYACVGG